MRFLQGGTHDDANGQQVAARRGADHGNDTPAGRDPRRPELGKENTPGSAQLTGTIRKPCYAKWRAIRSECLGWPAWMVVEGDGFGSVARRSPESSSSTSSRRWPISCLVRPSQRSWRWTCPSGCPSREIESATGLRGRFWDGDAAACFQCPFGRRWLRRLAKKRARRRAGSTDVASPLKHGRSTPRFAASMRRWQRVDGYGRRFERCTRRCASGRGTAGGR